MSPARAARRDQPRDPNLRPGNAGTLLVVLLATVVLVGAAPSIAGQQPPRHTDHDRAEPSAATLVATAQGMVDAGAHGLEAALEAEPRAEALESGERSHQLGSFLAEAAATEPRNVSLEPLLATLGPIGGEMGPALANLTKDAYTLFHVEEPDARPYSAAWANATRNLDASQRNLAALAEEGIETERLETLLAAYEDRFQQLPAIPGADARVEPSSAHFGDTVRITVVDPLHANETATLHALTTARELALDERGIAETQLRVPWTVSSGSHPVNVTRGEEIVQTQLEVRRVPTSWVDVRLDSPEPPRTWRAQLVDHREEGIANALTQVRITAQGSGPGSTGDNGTEGVNQARSISAQTNSDGHLEVGLEPGETQLRAVFEGNRTHEPARLRWTDPWLETTVPLEEVPQEPQGEEAAFDPFGLLTSPLLVAAALGGAVLLGVVLVSRNLGDLPSLEWHRIRFLGNDSADAPAGEEPKSPRASELSASHPVYIALKRAGYDPSRLTLREAARILEGMGAPDVSRWARVHERAYYRDRPIPPVPLSLETWAEGLA